MDCLDSEAAYSPLDGQEARKPYHLSDPPQANALPFSQPLKRATGYTLESLMRLVTGTGVLIALFLPFLLEFLHQ